MIILEDCRQRIEPEDPVDVGTDVGPMLAPIPHHWNSNTDLGLYIMCLDYMFSIRVRSLAYLFFFIPVV